MALVLKADCTAADAYLTKTVTLPSSWYIQADIAVPASTLSALQGASTYFTGDPISFTRSGWVDGIYLGDGSTSGSLNSPTTVNSEENLGSPAASVFPADTFTTVVLHYDGANMNFIVAGTTVISYAHALTAGSYDIRIGSWNGPALAGLLYYATNVKIGSTLGGTDIFADDFTGGDFSAWTSTSGSVSLVENPIVPPSPPVEGRVLIAFNDGPLVASPTWTRIDGGDAPFPDNFVSGYDVESGRQTLISQTDTGTATVYINDYETALFDPRNVSSPYFGLLDGRQILLQLYDPVAAAWEDQFRGLIDDITWDIDGSAVGADGEPINASIQIDCVDMFDYLAGYGLTPGLDGVTPRVVPSGSAGGAVPAGYEDGVYYAATAGSVDDRIIEILADVGIDPTRYTVASGNVHVKAVKYDPDESALQALRDAADAELPFIANIYCDRHGNFQFRGRYSRFDPDAVSSEPGSTWDFTRWAAGDGAAIIINSDRAQLRTFAFGRNRSDLINVAIAYPQGMQPADMPGQVWADTTSSLAYGKHSAPPMSDLLTDTSDVGGFTDLQETAKYAELLVKNQKDPRETVTTLGFKAIRPDGSSRAEKTWALITRADISHIVNVAVGYPAGTGLSGATPDDDYYIEGRRLKVRPLNADYDYVELELDVSPAVWSMDINNVFDPFPGPPSGLSASFSYGT